MLKTAVDGDGGAAGGWAGWWLDARDDEGLVVVELAREVLACNDENKIKKGGGERGEREERGCMHANMSERRSFNHGGDHGGVRGARAIARAAARPARPE